MMLKGAEVFAFIRSAIPFAKNCACFVAKALLQLQTGDKVAETYNCGIHGREISSAEK